MTAPPALEGLKAKFDHVAIGGSSFEPMLALYRDLLGGVPTYGGTNTALGFAVQSLDFPDGKHIELITATPGSTFLDSFLARTGGLGGLHHVTFTVPSVHQEIEVLHGRGYATFGERPDDPTWAEAFVHPRDAGGVLLQVATPGEHGDEGEPEHWESGGS
jgi:catechol 2,3-dioxygenase-like lactoylglutathione lyase family enzyme